MNFKSEKWMVTMGDREYELTVATGDAVKVGDKVIVGNNSGTWYVDKVTKVTSALRFRTEKGGYFKPDGKEVNRDRFYWRTAYLYSAEFIAGMRNERYKINTLGKLHALKSITFEQARAVSEILGFDGEIK